MGKWRRFWRLPSGERRVLLAAFVLLPVTQLGLLLVGFRRWQSFLMHLLPGHRPAGRASGDAKSPLQTSPAPADGNGKLAVQTCGEMTARMVQAAAREGLGRPNCLSRSLVLWWLLVRQGCAAELRIGTRKKDAALEAHAWVELAGRVLGEEDDPHTRYAAFEESIAAAPPRLNAPGQ